MRVKLVKGVFESFINAIEQFSNYLNNAEIKFFFFSFIHLEVREIISISILIRKKYIFK